MALLPAKTVAFIVAHPDDETLWVILMMALNRSPWKEMGQDWQTWSAALNLYAANGVEEKREPFFDEICLYPAKTIEGK